MLTIFLRLENLKIKRKGKERKEGRKERKESKEGRKEAPAVSQALTGDRAGDVGIGDFCPPFLLPPTALTLLPTMWL